MILQLIHFISRIVFPFNCFPIAALSITFLTLDQLIVIIKKLETLV